MYSAALREYVARHSPDEVTAAMDAVVADVEPEGPDAFVIAAARRLLIDTEW